MSYITKADILLTNLKLKIFFNKNFGIETIEKILDGNNVVFVPYSDEYFDNQIEDKDDSKIYIFYVHETDILMLSKVNEIKKQLKKPIIVITDRYDSNIETASLRLGADDYWCSINSKEIFRIRIENFVNKMKNPIFGNPLSLSNKNLNKIELLKDGAKWHSYFTAYELMVLTALLENDGQILTRENLSIMLKGHDSKNPNIERDRAADNLMSRIRAKLKKLGIYKNDIKCFNGVGYAFLGKKDELVSELNACFDKELK